MRYILLISMLAVLTGCPQPIEDLAPVTCDQGYHPCGPDSQDCCLDTTSHEFTWVFDTLGSFGSNLHDAFILGEDDIWLVGLVRVEEPDSSGSNMRAVWYNAIHWNGYEWSFHMAIDNTPIRSVFGFETDDVWFVNGKDIIHFDGSTFHRLWRAGYTEYNQVVTIWGDAPTNIYFAGKNGNILHYDGLNFTRTHTEIESNFTYITGSSDGTHVFLLGGPISPQEGDVILHSGNNLFNWAHIQYPLHSLLINDPLDAHSLAAIGNELYIAKNHELWKYNFNSGNSRLESDIDHIYEQYNFTKAESKNDIFFGGSKFNYIHYNGDSYQYVNEVQQNYNTIWMGGGDFKGNMAIMVGAYDLNLWHGAALVARGVRN